MYSPNSKCNIVLDGEKLEQTPNFEYLGSMLTSNGDCDTEIRRVGISKRMFMDMKHILTNKSISMDIRKRFLQCYIWPTSLYGCESWTISKKLQKHLEATEKWFFLRMLKIPWTKRKLIETILTIIQEEKTLMQTIRKRQLDFLGYIVRADSLEKLCIEGKADGVKPRGRPRRKYLEGLVLATRTDNVQLLRMAKNRNEYKRLVANVRI